MKRIVLNRQLLGLEDFLFGEGTETQIRGGQEVVITKINAGNLPFNDTQTLFQFLQSSELNNLKNSTPQLLEVYDNLTDLLSLISVIGDINTALDTINGEVI